MTGFGRARVSRDGRFVSLEVTSVNNRHLEINLSETTNPQLKFRIKNRIKERLHRGKVKVRIESNFLDLEAESVELNRELTEEYLSVASELADQFSALNNGVDVETLLSLPGVISLRRNPILDGEDEEVLMDAIDRVLDDLVQMRKTEGKKLRQDLSDRIGSIHNSLEVIEERFPEALEQYRRQLRKRFEEMLTQGEPQLTKELEDEVNRYADKCDISEEIVRIDSHINQFKEYLDKEDDPVGKKLKFLLQELQREVNTIGDKANDAEISQVAVEIKTELEKCREQVRNVE